jgi:hypothetical protein
MAEQRAVRQVNVLNKPLDFVVSKSVKIECHRVSGSASGSARIFARKVRKTGRIAGEDGSSSRFCFQVRRRILTS